jgi:ATP adenylyltransferase/5',5'''-P-1,P-4-tetraphosphate phosphorylase II
MVSHAPEEMTKDEYLKIFSTSLSLMVSQVNTTLSNAPKLKEFSPLENDDVYTVVKVVAKLIRDSINNEQTED